MFSIYDYLIFVLILVLTVLIGLHHTIRGWRSKNDPGNKEGKSAAETKLDEYVVANSTLGALPIALSLLATFFSATGILGIPAEIYSYGMQYWLSLIGVLLNLVIGAFVTGPFFAKFDLTSIFQYLELRFKSKALRIFISTP